MSNAARSSGLVAAGLGWGIAAGVALGTLLIAPAIGGSLGDAAQSAQQQSDDAAAEAAATDEAAEGKVREANELLADEGAAIVDGALTDVAVTIIRTNDASEEDAAGVRWMANAAGASNSGGIKLTDKFVDREAADELSSIIANTLPAGAQLSVENRSPGTHAGESLVAALAEDPEGGEAYASASDRDLVLEALEQAGFIEVQGTIVAAQRVIIVDGAGEGGGEEDAFAEQLLSDLATAMGAKAPVVVAAQGEPFQLDGAESVGYVDTEAGRIRAVLAAANQ